ncbi:uncharacterized protein DNG_08916 [Cephalotrichum gorgonifer]|uniref:Uncharacterized protein n=1 Tax=Cephalotrichum gorgonifer TaxID=2041049 RepID=A0AAE8SZN6_9PEZI|nr:uncharacterized protein DNG_08916 [Cephalotrichum gorgonifer]
MVLGIITAIAACPAIVGTNEAIMISQRKQAKEEHRTRKTNLVVACSDPSAKAEDVDQSFVVLRDHKLWIATRPDAEDDEGRELLKRSHRFAGYFFNHPEHKWPGGGQGFVSTIMEEPPMLNWIYVDKDTNEVKYGTKHESMGHKLGPWNCTPVDKRVTFEKWEGFCAVEEEPGRWGLYFDCLDDGLDGKVPLTKPMLEVELIRKEMRIPPVEEADQGPPS